MLDGSLLHNPRYFTQGAYGPWRALPRLLDLLAAYDLKATFFIPTWVVQHWTERCERIVAGGHEVGYHGHRHEVFIDLGAEQQLDVMDQSRRIFRERLGVTPIGFRTPSGDWANETATLLKHFASSIRAPCAATIAPTSTRPTKVAGSSKSRRVGT